MFLSDRKSSVHSRQRVSGSVVHWKIDEKLAIYRESIIALGRKYNSDAEISPIH